MNLFGFQVEEEEEELETTTIDHRCEVTGTRLNLRKNQGMKCYFLHPLARYSFVRSFVCSLAGSFICLKGGKFLKELRWCVGGEYYKIIWFYQLG